MKQFLILLLCCTVINLHAQQRTISGTVSTAANLQPLQGATIRLLPSGKQTVTNADGAFTIATMPADTAVQVSFIGYKNQQLLLTSSLTILLEADAASLENVVVNTGYQSSSRITTTGAFSVINNELLTRQLTTSVLDALDGIAPSLQFEKRPISNPSFSIRGRSTILGNTKPLIVLDGFPYEGDLDNLNPNNIESITILKDAAASAVWGVRASNGVVVITSKKGRYAQPLKAEYTINYSLQEQPDLHAMSMISTSDFIDAEQFLFSKGFYTTMETNVAKPVLSPVIEILIKQRDGLLTPAAAAEQINALRNNDVRNDFKKRIYSTASRFQQALNLRGGSEKMYWSLSAGHDKNVSALSDQYQRLSFRTDNGFKIAKGLELTAALAYTETNANAGHPGYNSVLFSHAPGKNLYPYTRFADDVGAHLPVYKDHRNSFIESAPSRGMLNWQFVPLDEIAIIDKRTTQQDVIINTGLKYQLFKSLSAELYYQYEKANFETRDHRSIESYSTRNEINRFSQLNTAGNVTTRPVPLGGIMDLNTSYLNAWNLRGQLRYEQNIKEHRISILAGAEERESENYSYSSRLYGYNDNVLTSVPVNFDSSYRLASNVNSTSKISNGISLSHITNRFRSLYTTAAYSYRNKYFFTASARRDGSNIFGVNTNQKFVPLWSAGAAWLLSKESFYKVAAIPHLKVRFSYGYSGNIDNTLSAFTIVRYTTGGVYSLPIASLNAAANPDLRWERVRMINLGIDFSAKNDVITGSVDVWQKKATDLVGLGPLDPTTGVWITSLNSSFSFKGNIADMKGKGVDVELTTKNIDRRFKWSTNFLFSYATDKVTSYAFPSASTSPYLSSLTVNPVVGRSVYGLYSYRWAGLDTAGNPQGIAEDKVSTDYLKLVVNAKPSDLVYHGNAVAPFFGAIRNTFSYGNLSLSANITYRLGYWFRRNSISYAALFNSNFGHGDYSKRWQQKGDEAFTDVPSMIYPVNLNRESFYLNSEALVEKGDHFRLADVRLDYVLTKQNVSWLPLQQLRCYVHLANPGFIWKASKSNADPDTQSEIPLQKQLTIGCKINF